MTSNASSDPKFAYQFLLQVVEAAQTGNVDVIREFIVRGGDVNRTWENYWKEGDGPGATSGRDPAPLDNSDGTTGVTLTILAAFKDQLPVLRLLLENGADFNANTSANLTALHYACAFSENLDLMEFLTRGGAILGATGHRLETPLHCAVYRGNRVAVDFCLRRGLDINVAAHNNLTPLHVAALMNDDADFLRFLMDLGADENLKDEQGQTIIHCAASQGHRESVEFAVGVGLDPWVKNVQGEDAFDLAVEGGHEDVVDVLQDAILKELGLCSFCEEAVCDVKFEACCHRGACHECSKRWKRCKVVTEDSNICNEEIVRRVRLNPSLLEISAKKMRIGGRNSRGGDDDEREQKFLKQKEDYLCIICYTEEKEVVFNCGHQACRQCVERLVDDRCHVCRTPITARIRLY